MSKTPGLDMTTGSLGHGLSVGVGMCLGLRACGADSRVYVMLGDGELNEGQVWEAAMAAAKFRLGNLTVFVDYNDLQLDGYCQDIMPLEPLADKWGAFNWQVHAIDGNDMEAVVGVVEEILGARPSGPQVVIARTVKGRGVSFMENQCDWHGRAPNAEEYGRAMRELRQEPGGEPRFDRGVHPSHWKAPPRLALAGAREAPTRDAYGEALVELGPNREDVVVLEADISKSTRTQAFSKAFPDRFYQFGVAEANTMNAAVGLATTGKIPFVSTYSVFASMRACEQIRTSVAYPRLNVKIAVSHGGINPGNDGVTHQATEDLGIVRTIPGTAIVVPADFHATKALVKLAVGYPGPVYLRLTRDAVPFIYRPEDVFEIGKANREGDDVLLVATGDMLWVCVEAAYLLERKGIHACVLDMHTVKPLDGEALLAAAWRTGCVVSVEDHQVQCGLGGAVAELLGEACPVPLRRVGLRDTFAESGAYELLLTKYGMDELCVVEAAQQVMARKRGEGT